MTIPELYQVQQRKTFTQKQRVKMFQDEQGICCVCGIKINGVKEAWIIEHKIPIADTLSNEDANRRANLGVAHEKCGHSKTSREATSRAKLRSAGAKHIGAAKTQRGRPLPGTKASGLRKRMNGTVERW